jgi:putative endonuclease
MSNQSLGRLGEECAVEYLKNKGYQILDSNFRNKLGEIDLIAKDGKVISFIEVKTRKSNQFGAPFEAVHSTKQYKMVRLALSYLKYKFHSVEILCRFDVISIHFDSSNKPIIQHIQNAFDLTYLSH